MIYQPLRNSKEMKGMESGAKQSKGKGRKGKRREGKPSYGNFERIQSRIVANRVQ